LAAEAVVRIHIAARHELRAWASRIATRLQRAGHRVVSRWIDGDGRAATTADNARYTLTDILVADCVLLLSDGGRKRRAGARPSDRHVEFGYALRAGKRLCVLGSRETSFAHLPAVERYGTVKDLIDGLR
jgi:hypothetical protein